MFLYSLVREFIIEYLKKQVASFVSLWENVTLTHYTLVLCKLNDWCDGKRAVNIRMKKFRYFHFLRTKQARLLFV